MHWLEIRGCQIRPVQKFEFEEANSSQDLEDDLVQVAHFIRLSLERVYTDLDTVDI